MKIEGYIDPTEIDKGAFARLENREIKQFNGHSVTVTKRLSICNGLLSEVYDDILNLTLTINEAVGFWKSDNPLIYSGYMFNGSSQHLMNKSLHSDLETYKGSFGDIDVIVPIEKLQSLENYLDLMDNDEVNWHPSTKNKINEKFYYIGRTKGSYIPDQRFTFWLYVPQNIIVQIDFEGDYMETETINGIEFERPSQWTKFSKDSPIKDLRDGIKGLAGAILLRSLVRCVTKLNNVVVLTPTGTKKIESGIAVTEKDISKSKQHQIPSSYTLNTGGSGQGIRKAYRKVGKLYDGRDAYTFINPTMAKSLGSEFQCITDLKFIFKTLFGVSPSSYELENFRSFVCLCEFMKNYLNRTQINETLNRFHYILKDENLSTQELNSIEKILLTSLS